MKFISKDKTNVMPRRGRHAPKRLYKRVHAEISCYKIEKWSCKDGVTNLKLGIDPIWSQLFKSQDEAKTLMMDLYYGEVGE